MKNKINQILDYWFGPIAGADVPSEDHRGLWWKKDEENDNRIRGYFENDIKMATQGKLDDWSQTPNGTLALIILLDQFSRNIYRDTAKAFSQDKKAVLICYEGIEKGFDKKLHPAQRTFFYMPLMHSEKMDDQENSIKLFRNLCEQFSSPEPLSKMLNECYEYAIKHFEIVKRFGRYPHRNQILGRKSTPEEVKFLSESVSAF